MSNLIRRDPLDDLFRGFFVRPSSSNRRLTPPAVKIDVKEQENSYLVTLNSGVKRKTSMLPSMAPLSPSPRAARRERCQGRRKGAAHRALLRQVSRSFQLAQNRRGAGDRQYTDGVLELALPKKAATQARRITIQ